MFDHIHPLILPLGFFFLANSIVGVIGNVVMVLCFFRTRRLRSPCHILITMNCISDLAHLCGQFVFSVHLFGNLTSTQAQCMYMLIIPMTGVCAAGPLILAMGADRLIAVKYPTKYRYFQQEPKYYVLGHMIIPVAYTVFTIGYAFETRITDVKIQVTCAMPVGFNDLAFQFFTYSSAVIYAVVVIVYFTVYVLLKSSNASSRFKSVFKSIAVTVGFVIFGWVTTTIANTFSYHITNSSFNAMVIQMYAGITVNISASSNVFVFYAINSEYREVIKALLGLHSKANSPLFEASSTQNITVRKKSQVGITLSASNKSLNGVSKRVTVI